MNLSDLGKHTMRTRKRVGRGTGSGRGKTSGRGNNGSGQRKGKKIPYLGFKGGNLPYYRKIPKRGFTSPCPRIYEIVNLKDIARAVPDEKEITPETLKTANLIKNTRTPVKILAATAGKYSCKATVKADAFSSKAKTLIEQAGGKAECLKR
ncbi:MAG: 50S ribosomal protein L15 [Candidatus Omnitrophica bacterium]|nr:50S ribosomal protein L15 [Candidatus Omnitrophota bacterium]